MTKYTNCEEMTVKKLFMEENGAYSITRENVENTLERVFRTETGRALLRAMYL